MLADIMWLVILLVILADRSWDMFTRGIRFLKYRRAYRRARGKISIIFILCLVLLIVSYVVDITFLKEYNYQLDNCKKVYNIY